MISYVTDMQIAIQYIMHHCKVIPSVADQIEILYISTIIK